MADHPQVIEAGNKGTGEPLDSLMDKEAGA